MRDDRSSNTFWAGEKFVIKAVFETSDDTNYNDDTLLKKVKIKGTDYQTTAISTSSQDGKIVQTAAIWKEDMIKNLRDGSATFEFTFNDGTTKEKTVNIDSTTEYYRLHMKN